MKTIYIVCKEHYDWDDNGSETIRAFSKESDAVNYVKKANRIWKACKKFYKRGYNKYMNNIKDRSPNNQIYCRKYRLFDKDSFEYYSLELID